MQAALSVSEYTDKVDILSWKTKISRVHAQIKVGQSALILRFNHMVSYASQSCAQQT